jgi:hypothetical protein
MDDKARSLISEAETHAERRATGDAERCFRQACSLLSGDEKAECLMACWRMLISAIADNLYDCGFEWRGDLDGSHDADSRGYREAIDRYRQQGRLGGRRVPGHHQQGRTRTGWRMTMASFGSDGFAAASL